MDLFLYVALAMTRAASIVLDAGFCRGVSPLSLSLNSVAKLSHLFAISSICFSCCES